MQTFTIIILGICALPLLLIGLRAIFIKAGWRFRRFEKFCCWIGWHWKVKYTGFDGVSLRATCTSCKKKGLIDGNGDFFETEFFS